MFSTDQTHLRRYFATLGVAIAAGTLSLAGLFLKLQQDLIVTQSTIARITPAARAALLKRQEYLLIGTIILPWFVLVGFLGGLGLSVYGIVGWAKRQKVIDEREDIGLRKEQVELRQLTDAEKAKKLDRDAKESMRETSSPSHHASNSDFVRARADIANIEDVLVDKLRQIYTSSEVLENVGLLTSTGQRLEVDAMVRQDIQQRETIFELKYASNPESIPRLILAGLHQLERATSLANAKGCLIIIAADSASPDQIERWNTQAERKAATLGLEVGVYVGRRADFVALPAREFAAQLGLDYPKTK